MQLRDFIVDNLEVLVDDWTDFARRLPECADLGRDALRDHAEAMLRAIAADMGTSQSLLQQVEKSHGLAPRLGPGDTRAEQHGLERFQQGLGLNGLVAEFRALRASVLRRWTLVRGTASADMLEELVRFNEGIDQAIAESLQRFVEELRREQEAIARRAEQRLDAAMIEARMGFWEWDPVSDRIEASPTMNGLLGLPLDGPPLTGARRLALLHADDRPAYAGLAQQAAAQRRGWRTLFRVPRASGAAPAWLEERAMPTVGEGGRLLVSGLTWDITERRRAEQSLLEADQRKDRFLATLAHELRNPLAPIRQSASLVLQDERLPTPLRWSVAVIERQAGKMALLLDDLLDVSRITRGHLQLRREPVDMAEVVRSAIETVAPVLEAEGHVLHMDLPEAPLRLGGDALRLSQVVANLLTNAARYSEPGRPIELVVRRQGAVAELTVRDHGIGIPPDQLDAVFEMFGRGTAPEAQQRGGLGVGLALSRGLVHLHGGTLEARSDGRGQGACFVVRLPLSAQAAPSSPADVPPPPSAVAPARVLVIDDNADAADSLALLLRLQGHEVHVAYAGAEGVARAAQFDPDIVLLDLGMPGMDGYEVARRLRAAGGHGRPTLVAVSGWGQSSDRRRSADAGVDVHLTKPVDEAKLQAVFSAPRPPRPRG